MNLSGSLLLIFAVLSGLAFILLLCALGLSAGAPNPRPMQKSQKRPGV